MVSETIAPVLRNTINLFFDLPADVQELIRVFNGDNHIYQLKMVIDQFNQMIVVCKKNIYMFSCGDGYEFSIIHLNIPVHSKNWHRHYRSVMNEISYTIQCRECNKRIKPGSKYCNNECSYYSNAYYDDYYYDD
jgi:hypothetical protein